MNLIADAEVIPGLRETNGHLNGEVIRLDGSLRMAPR